MNTRLIVARMISLINLVSVHTDNKAVNRVCNWHCCYYMYLFIGSEYGRVHSMLEKSL